MSHSDRYIVTGPTVKKQQDGVKRLIGELKRHVQEGHGYLSRYESYFNKVEVAADSTSVIESGFARERGTLAKHDPRIAAFRQTKIKEFKRLALAEIGTTKAEEKAKAERREAQYMRESKTETWAATSNNEAEVISDRAPGNAI